MIENLHPVGDTGVFVDDKGNFFAVVKFDTLEQAQAALGSAPAAPRAPRAPRPTPARRAGKRVRRSAEEIAQMEARVWEYVHQHPGVAVSDVAAATGLQSRDASTALKALRSQGRVRTEGEKRNTRYFPGSEGTGEEANGGKAGRKGRK